MIKISLSQIKNRKPCESGWEKLLASKGADAADMELQFPVTDIITSNGFDDALWALRCLPEHNNLWRKLAVSYARDVQHLMTDQRSFNALDVAWRHSEGLATEKELRAAEDAAADAAADAVQDAVWAAEDVADAAGAAAAAAEDAVWDAVWAAAWAAEDVADVAGAARAARAAKWAAVRQKQQVRLIAILTAGEWVEGGE